MMAAITAWVRTHVKNETGKAILLRLDDAVEAVVRKFAAVIVPEIRAALADGEITKEEGEKIKRLAKAEIKRYLGESFVSTAEKVLGKDELMAMLDAKIEAWVQKIKNEEGN